MKLFFNSLLATSLVLAAAATSAPNANAGIFVSGTYAVHSTSEDDDVFFNQGLKEAMIPTGIIVAIVGVGMGNTLLAVIGLPAPVSNTEGFLSTELPFLNASDVYALGAMISQKIDQGQMTRVNDSRAGQGYEVKLDKAEILSVMSGNYSTAEIDRAVRILD